MNHLKEEDSHVITGSKFGIVSAKIKPIAKRVAKSAAVVCVSLTAGSLSAVAKENLDKAKTVAKAAKSAKTSGKRMKRVAEVGSALFFCANAGQGAVEEVVSNNGSKVFKVVLFGVIWFCGFYCGKESCE